ncbi:hypothetical protein E1B28_011600 [Marasmius oreades]|uniref:Uncharacterized protein n=1 Tax=Marasmius oreades TaxID=181124 RepID=A0A9P7UQE1_9AGAR|nr:uncharacterized protein E1B28_011600 [Marasmius oreades]KAG7089975.1 hypothetical protein E1B28_011600 [Marasmius oreades]
MVSSDLSALSDPLIRRNRTVTFVFITLVNFAIRLYDLYFQVTEPCPKYKSNALFPSRNGRRNGADVSLTNWSNIRGPGTLPTRMTTPLNHLFSLPTCGKQTNETRAARILSSRCPIGRLTISRETQSRLDV